MMSSAREKHICAYWQSEISPASVSIVMLAKQTQSLPELQEERCYAGALSAFEKIENFSDSKEKIDECTELLKGQQYQGALAMMKNGEYAEAKDAFEALSDYSDAKEQADKCQELKNEEDYHNALRELRKVSRNALG